MITRVDIYKALQDDETLRGVNQAQRIKFIRWYPFNLHVINEFEQITRYLREKGNREYYSARAIFEHMRWNSMVSDSEQGFKLTDNVCSSIVRVVVKLYPEYSGMFRMKGMHEFSEA